MDDGFTTRLGAGQALTLAATRAPRRLQVTHGLLWVTLTGGSDDHWISAGEGLTLAAGREAVVEGWPTAAFQLLQPAPSRWSAPVRRPTLAAA
ncbi:DUF2917 domain-containing protein [Roseateles asaccharophilus]|uniref:DUF2917 domain-containing protein n=1 Tax=Roseateles asaccharophilus TaxID=582607 RepID=A0ABU2A6D9_9BURK|nr:DUF2917 domain-containing protein [Roseateles asaccharophilus]MDR7332760.1 hypothetical protein [Roseateles asaccharophilus]